MQPFARLWTRGTPTPSIHSVSTSAPKSKLQAREGFCLVKHSLCNTKEDLLGSDSIASRCSCFIHYSIHPFTRELKNEFIHSSFIWLTNIRRHLLHARQLCWDLGFTSEPDGQSLSPDWSSWAGLVHFPEKEYSSPTCNIRRVSSE